MWGGYTTSGHKHSISYIEIMELSKDKMCEQAGFFLLWKRHTMYCFFCSKGCGFLPAFSQFTLQCTLSCAVSAFAVMNELLYMHGESCHFRYGQSRWPKIPNLEENQSKGLVAERSLLMLHSWRGGEYSSAVSYTF